MTTNENELACLRSWAEAKENLPDKVIDDHLLARFLHCCNYNLDHCKSIIERFFNLRGDAQEFFVNRDPFGANIQSVFDIIDIIPLPKVTPEGYKVFLYRLSNPDPEKFNHLDYIRTFFLIADTRIKTEEKFPAGEVPIFDMSGFSLKHLIKLNLSALRKQMMYVQEAHPVKLRQIHVINTVPLLERVMTLFRPLMKKEVAAMLHFHLPNSNTLEEFIPKNILPDEYGGQAGAIKDLKNNWITKVQSERDWLISNPWHSINPKEDKKQDKIIVDSFKSLMID